MRKAVSQEEPGERNGFIAMQTLCASRLIVATNRGPIEYFLEQDGSLKHHKGGGGMITSLLEVSNQLKMTWVAMAMTDGDRLALQCAQHNNEVLHSPLLDQKVKLRYVAIPKTAYQKHYDKICNELLWFSQHYLYELIKNSSLSSWVQDAWANGYRIANQAIADEVCAEIESEPTSVVVMLHDYHLYLSPAMIRKRHPHIVLQQFIHIPWPDVRSWNFLPSDITHAIYSGLVSNDIVGFHTEQDAHNFLEGARSVLDNVVVNYAKEVIEWQGHYTRVRTYPSSISIVKERCIAHSMEGRRAVEMIRPLLGEKTIMRVDRIDPSKNIVSGFLSYALLLDEHPELLGKVVFLAFLVPSRQSLPIYQHYNAEISRVIQEINQRYGTEEWTPIHAIYGDDRTQALAGMQLYDVLLVNPIIDGMNIVAKEGPIVNQRNGVLVLSYTAGAYQQIGKGAIPIAPMDIVGTSRALYKALTMSLTERSSKLVQTQHAIENYDLTTWLGQQINDINVELANLQAYEILK